MNQLVFKNPKMNGMVRILCLITAWMIGIVHVTAQLPKPDVHTIPEVTIAGTQLLHFQSVITKKDYNLYINLPAGYKDTAKAFPVLFLLDAQWDFPLVQAIYGEQYFDGFIPEIVIVGITWGGINPDYDKLRAQDFTPTDISKTGSFGNASNFLSFISKELIPFVEANYRIKPDDRTLMGSSLGGLFSLYALFQEPAVFNRFIFTSPAIQWDNYMVKSPIDAFASQNEALNARVYAAIGEYENVDEFQNFMNGIRIKNFKNLDLQTSEVKGMGHSGAKAEGYARGIQSVFRRPVCQVDPSILATYSGEYQVSGTITVNMSVENGQLVVNVPGNGKFSLQATGNEDFYVNGQFLNLHFVKDSSGQVTGFNLQQYNGQTFFSRIKK